MILVFPLTDHVVDAINEFCSQDVHIRFGDKKVYRCRAFLDRLSMDGAEVAAACLGNTRNCLTCWCPKNQLADTDRCHPLRKVSDLLTRLDQYRDDLLDEEGEPLDRCIGKVGDAERELRHKLLPKNAWLRVKFFELFSSCPKDELHQWYLGLFGEHIIPAIFYRYEQALLDENGDFILSKASMEAIWQRLADRLQTIVADTSMLILLCVEHCEASSTSILLLSTSQPKRWACATPGFRDESSATNTYSFGQCSLALTAPLIPKFWHIGRPPQDRSAAMTTVVASQNDRVPDP